MTPGNLRLLTELVRERSGIVLGPEKLYHVRTKLEGLLRHERLADLDALAARLGDAPSRELTQRVVEAVTVNETLFFRDAHCFEHLARVALPTLRARRGDRARPRLWSAAASTGQEAYSLAIVAEESSPAASAGGVEILATDIARPALQRAEAALYTQFEVGRGLSPARLRAHFGPEPGGWRVRPGLRASVRCRAWNLLDDPAPLGRFDVVFCRHVLLYFAAETRRRLLDRIAERLAPDGYLYIGGTETLMGLTDRFVPIPGARGVFTRSAG